MKKTDGFHSRVYTDRPEYADLPAPEKFQAIQGIIATRLRQHPNAICSYSGGSDSDILLDLLESTRQMFPSLSPVKYCFFNTGLEMDATKRHVKEVAEKYDVEIIEHRPAKGKNIVLATRTYGQPFISKIMSTALEVVQKKQIPLSIKTEYDEAEDKQAKRQELKERYPGAETAINFLCCCNN
ncbi:MAG: phosphoadenosine phosphosulfate reductase family protein, partial [Clostridia bacterium]|nr:phosphoadenosine phosphosulfate reductase family protein [Clostridia bacterium]